MISICIPIYNKQIGPLIQALLSQIKSATASFEIICMDDASLLEETRKHNRAACQGDQIQYIQLAQNVGRARIRNLLAKASSQPYLLFLDCDVSIPDHFIDTYLACLDTNDVLYGGTSYPSAKPEDVQLHLHWTYGHRKETRTVIQRQETPYHSFKTNNFLTPKEYLLHTPFNEALTQYGHEDTLWSIQLKQAGIKVQHLDNPITHLGLECNDVLLRKIEMSLENIIQLTKSGIDLPIRVVRTYHTIKWLLFSSYVRVRLLDLMKSRLLNQSTNMWLVDAYKLLYLAQQDYLQRSDS